MGRIKRWREAHPRFRDEEPDSRPSLLSEAAGWLEGKPAAARAALAVGGCAVAAAVLVGTVGWAASAAYSPEPDTGYEDGSGTSASSGESQYSGYFQDIGRWTFLRSPETIAKVEDDIYGQLLAGGLSEGEFVAVYDGFDQTDTGYVGYFRDTPRGKFWKATFEAGSWDVAIEESSQDDMPKPAGADRIEEDSWEQHGSAAAQQPSQSQQQPASAAQQQATSAAAATAQPATEAQSQQARIDASNGTALSDEAGLSAILPRYAAQTAPKALTAGASANYGVRAQASSSFILNSSVKASGQNCEFRVKLADGSGKSVVLDVSYDSSTGRFTGTKAA